MKPKRTKIASTSPFAKPADASRPVRPVVSGDLWTVAGIGIFLVAITLAVFGQTVRHEFLNFDDNLYVYDNPAITHGLSLKSIGWAFTHVHANNWHPLTTISHMLDCQLFGLNPGGHHLTNILLHATTVLLLFLVLRNMTGALWRSAFVAAVFAIHPLRAESVAWVAERKDLLSGGFFMLTLWAYVRYVRQPWRLSRYLAVVAFFAMGLLSKPMLVTLPLVLLLLDYWPLGRFAVCDSRFAILRLFTEKIPLLLLAIASCVVTVLVQGDAVQSVERFTLPLRISNAAVSYAAYLGQMFYPAGLAAFYPYQIHGLPLWEIIWSLLLVAAISVGAFRWRKARPYLLVGWLWYLGMLVPVIGLVQVGFQARADRYTYLPQVGLYLMVTFGMAELSARWRLPRWILGGLATLVIAGLAVCAGIQTAYWKNSETLWNRALAVTTDNAIAHINLGDIFFKRGQVDVAIAHYKRVVTIQPHSPGIYYDLGIALLEKGRVDEAIVQFQKAVEIKPDYAEAHNNLGNALMQKKQADEALVHYQKALRINPDKADFNNNLGTAYLQKKQMDLAIACFQKAVALQPDFAEAHYNLAFAYTQTGRLDDAVAQFQKAIGIRPAFAQAHADLGLVLAHEGRLDEAVAQYQKALETQPTDAETLSRLGYALFQKGQMDAAIDSYQKSLNIEPQNAPAHNNLGNAFFQQGRMDEAVVHFQKALEIQPGYALAHNNLAVALIQKGDATAAITHYQKLLELQPNNAVACKNLAWILATWPDASARNGTRAVGLAQRAVQLSGGNNPLFTGTLAAAYAESGQYSQAVTAARQAQQSATDQINADLVKALQAQIELYQANSPFRTTNQITAPVHP